MCYLNLYLYDRRSNALSCAPICGGSDKMKEELWAIAIVYVIIFGLTPGAIAEHKGRNPVAYCVTSLFFSLIGGGLIIWAILTPLYQTHFIVYLLIGGLLSSPGLILTILVPKTQEQREKDKLKSGKFKKCPACIEAIPAEATICRYCRTDLPIETDDSKQ